MNALIVEDEDLAVRKLRKLIQDVDPTVTIAGVTASIEDSVEWLQANPAPDVIFMDIELADGQSFEIFERTEVQSTVIFTTSYDEYALQAFKVNSIDYRLKPIQKEDLQRALKKFYDLHRQPTGSDQPATTSQSFNLDKLLHELQRQQQPKDYRRRFLVRQGQRLLSIETGDIAYFYTDERFSFFRTHANQKFLVDYTLDELADALDPASFSALTGASSSRIRPLSRCSRILVTGWRWSCGPASTRKPLSAAKR